MSSPKVKYNYNPRIAKCNDVNTKKKNSVEDNGRKHYDLSMLLIGEPKNNFDSLEMKLALVKSGDDLGNDAFAQAALFLKLFTRSGVISREKGAKEKHKHLHMVFNLCYPKEPKYRARLRKFVRNFILGIPPEKEKIFDNLPDSIRKHLPKYDVNVCKEISSSHKLSLAPIEKTTETFSLQAGYLLKDMGKPHFLILSHKISKEELCVAYKDYMQKTRFEPNSDKEIIHCYNVVTVMRRFIYNTFGTSDIDFILALFYKIEFGNAVFDNDFLKQQSGRVLDYSRTKAWMKLSNDSYKYKTDKIQDINILVFGGEKHNIQDIMESDLTYDRFMELQEQNVDEALDTGFALINGQMPITTDYNDITEEFILENTNKKHMALAYSTMKEFAAKNITINHKEDMDSIVIEEPMFLTDNVIIDTQTKKGKQNKKRKVEVV